MSALAAYAHDIVAYVHAALKADLAAAAGAAAGTAGARAAAGGKRFAAMCRRVLPGNPYSIPDQVRYLVNIISPNSHLLYSDI